VLVEPRLELEQRLARAVIVSTLEGQPPFTDAFRLFGGAQAPNLLR